MTNISQPAVVGLQHSPAVLGSHNPKAAFQSAVSTSPPYSRQPTTGPDTKLLQRRAHDRHVFAAAVTSIVSLVTILAILAVCRTAQRKLDSGAAVRRNLSSSDDPLDWSQILKECVDLEEEHGLGQPLPVYGEDANEAKARLVAMMYESAASFERERSNNSQGLKDEVQQPPAKVPRFDERLDSSTSHLQPLQSLAFWPEVGGTAVDSVHNALDADAWVKTEPELAFGEDKQQLLLSTLNKVSSYQQDASGSQAPSSTSDAKPATGQLASVSVGSAFSGEPIPREAWLYEPGVSAYPTVFQQSAQRTVWQSAKAEAASAAPISAGAVAVSTTTEVGGIGGRGIASADVGWRGALPQQGVQDVENHGQASVPVVNSFYQFAAFDGVGTGSNQFMGPLKPRDIRKHPFVRLPVVRPEDVQTTFSASFALSSSLCIRSPMDAYMAMRALFAKPSLTPQDVEALITEAELLVNYATHALGKGNVKRTASYLCMKLSALFMVFDHVVGAIEVVGEKMDTATWWDQFVQRFPTQYSFPERSGTDRTQLYSRMVNRLSSALSIYKTGKRPALQEIIDLKRLVIRHANKDSQLAHPQWQLWLQDDKEFYGSGDDSNSTDDTLTVADVELLMTEAEVLASYATVKLGKPYTRRTANYLVRKLSSVLMVFDFLVCTIQLLGDKMNTDKWWPQFVKKFRTENYFPETSPMRKTRALNKLVNRLSSALSVYKSGRRPDLREVVELKRIVITNAYRETQLWNPLWKIWMEDDDDEFCRRTGSPCDAQQQTKRGAERQ